MRKGYGSEYRTKKELIKQFGNESVVKVAISQQGADFLVLGCGELCKVIEVKETVSKKYYPSQKELQQMQRILDFAKIHKCSAEVWVYTNLGSGKKLNLEIKSVQEFIKQKP